MSPFSSVGVAIFVSMKKFIVFVFTITFIWACQTDKFSESPVNVSYGTPLEIERPPHFPPMYESPDNPTTVEGVKLGRFLFYEKKLSGNDSMSCASCHQQEYNFAEPFRFSTGIDYIQGDRNAMAIVNMVYNERFFWNGRKFSLEEQAVEPVINPIEMHNTWSLVVDKLSADPKYVTMFEAAFGPNSISQENATKAIAQFERTLLSANSKYDKYRRGEYTFTPSEQLGYEMFRDEGADCFHCHAEPLFGSFGTLQFENNGLLPVYDSVLGLEEFTGNMTDRGKFKIPTLRNIEWSFPYMHDGRMQLLDSVIDFYNTGGHQTPYTSPNMKKQGVGFNWTDTQKQALKDFLLTLTDEDFLSDTSFSDPHK